MARLPKKSVDKATPIKNTIEMKNQYVPTPKITPEDRKKAIESRLVSGSVSVTRELVNLPCGPIPDCNTIKVEQVVGLENNSLVYSNPNTTDGGLTHTSVDGTITFIKLSHTELLSFTANTPLIITHNLNSTSVSVTAYLDGEEVSVTVNGRTANTIDITSTITDDIEIIIRK